MARTTPGGGSGTGDSSDSGSTAPDNDAGRVAPDPVDGGGGDGGGSSGGASGGSSPTRSETRVESVTSGISNVVDSGVDSAQNTFDAAQSRVNDVSKALPGRTGEAFAAGVGVAAVPEPTPVTETTGAAIAGGAALVGGGVLASQYLRQRAGEVGVGERVQSELGIGRSRTDVSEVGAGATQTTTEIEPGATGPSTTQVGLGSTTAAGEIDVPGDGAAGSGAAINVAEQLGIGEQSGAQISQEEETFTIGRDTIADEEQTSDLREDEQLRQIREELERRQEFVRDVPEGGVGDRDPVRFPADDAATGTAPSIIEQVGSDFAPGASDALGTAAAGGATTPDFLAGDRVSDDVAGAGTDPTSGADTGIENPFGDAFGLGAQAEPTADTTTTTTTETGGTTDTGTDTGTATTQDVITETTAVNATTSAQAQAEAVSEATPQQFAEPELTTFQTQGAQPTAPGTGTGSSSRRRRPRPDPDRQSDGEPFRAAFGTRADDFDSGILSGQEAVESLDGLRF